MVDHGAIARAMLPRLLVVVEGRREARQLRAHTHQAVRSLRGQWRRRRRRARVTGEIGLFRLLLIVRHAVEASRYGQPVQCVTSRSAAGHAVRRIGVRIHWGNRVAVLRVRGQSRVAADRRRARRTGGLARNIP